MLTLCAPPGAVVRPEDVQDNEFLCVRTGKQAEYLARIQRKRLDAAKRAADMEQRAVQRAIDTEEERSARRTAASTMSTTLDDVLTMSINQQVQDIQAQIAGRSLEDTLGSGHAPARAPHREVAAPTGSVDEDAALAAALQQAADDEAYARRLAREDRASQSRSRPAASASRPPSSSARASPVASDHGARVRNRMRAYDANRRAALGVSGGGHSTHTGRSAPGARGGHRGSRPTSAASSPRADHSADGRLDEVRRLLRERDAALSALSSGSMLDSRFGGNLLTGAGVGGGGGGGGGSGSGRSGGAGRADFSGRTSGAGAGHRGGLGGGRPSALSDASGGLLTGRSHTGLYSGVGAPAHALDVDDDMELLLAAAAGAHRPVRRPARRAPAVPSGGGRGRRRAAAPVEHSRGLSPDSLARLPTHSYSARSDGGAAAKCSVCWSDYASGDLLRRLPCMHQFHRRCVDQWLGAKRECPVCRQEVNGE